MEFKGTKGRWILRDNRSTIMSEEQCLVARVFDGKGYALLDGKKQSEGIVEANALLMSKAPELLEMLSEASSVIQRLKLSMLVHPDCQVGSEFDDYTSLAQETEDEIEKLIKEATNLNHAKEDADS